MSGSFKIIALAGLAVVQSAWGVGAEDVQKNCELPSEIMTGNVINLDGRCTYSGSIKITKSNTVLDCNGAELLGQRGDKYGILIRGRGLHDVTVKNCRIKGYDKAAVMIMSGLKSYQLSKDHAQSYKMAPSRVLLESLIVEGARGNGVHFNGYVNNSTLRSSQIYGSRGVAVYLGGSTQSLTIENNVFKNNGGVNEKKQREALAVDSSAKNIIRDNKFFMNAAGGIFLYKNCGEHSDRPGATLRWQSSNDNVISGNLFYGEKIGVWIASRQSKDLSGWKCGDPSVGEGGKFYRDYANHNSVTANVFCNNKLPIKVEGDMNRIELNQFDFTDRRTVYLPYISKPKPDGTMSKGNVVGDLKGLNRAGRELCGY